MNPASLSLLLIAAGAPASGQTLNLPAGIEAAFPIGSIRCPAPLVGAPAAARAIPLKASIHARTAAFHLPAPAHGISARANVKGMRLRMAELSKAFSRAASPEVEAAAPVVLVDAGIESTTASEIKAVVLAQKELVSRMAGRVQVRFERHNHPRNPLVLIDAVNGYRGIFYLFEAQERLWKAKFRWKKPWTWLPPGPVDPGTMDIAVQTWAVLLFADYVSGLCPAGTLRSRGEGGGGIQ